MLGEAWEILEASPNALLLDTARVCFGNAPWSEPMFVLDIQESLSDAEPGTPFALAFVFEVEAVPTTPVDLVLETPEEFRLELNGEAFSSAPSTWWLDPTLRRINLLPLRKGENRLVLRGYAAEATALEALYLLGDFGVRGLYLGAAGTNEGQRFDRYAPQFSLTTAPRQLVSSPAPSLRFDLTCQRFPFLAGRVRLQQQVRLEDVTGTAHLTIHGLRAAVTHIWVNGAHAGTLAWEPYNLDITTFLQAGENRVELELVGTLRNLLGPHHLKGGDRAWTGPQQFRDPRRWTEDVILTPFGLEGAEIGLQG